MVHLSEVLNLPVFDSDGAKIGRLDDLHVDSVRSLVESVVVRGRGQRGSVAWRVVDKFSAEDRRITLATKDLSEIEKDPDRELIALRRDVLDRQIIDIRGRKVVNVNDILLEPVGADLSLRRVEVGLAGAVRRLLAGIVSPRLVRRIADGLPEQGIPWVYVGMTHISRPTTSTL